MIIEVITGIIVGSIIQAPILWISGRILVGTDQAKFMDAVWITALATTANIVLGSFVGSEVGGLVQLLIYLFLVSKYYETGWIKAAMVAVLNVVISAIIMWALLFLGVTSVLF
ncbi:hypothetical protein H8D76_02455 [Candidatus Bathyarchaeota archaeon]|nr:hypothetical protein [Candidatus Bathyarchaeota archaeon]